jgi:hypothetical protein
MHTYMRRVISRRLECVKKQVKVGSGHFVVVLGAHERVLSR